MTPKVAIASVSLGRPAAGHGMEQKLAAAASAGFDGIELTIECLTDHSITLSQGAITPQALRTGAADIRRIADELSLEIMALQPFAGYDALLDSAARLEDAKVWIGLCQILGAKIFQIPTCTYPVKPEEMTTNFGVIARNLRALVDLTSAAGIIVAYEAPAWGVACHRWQEIDEIIRLVDRPGKIKHCLDTFHIASIYAGDLGEKALASVGLQEEFRSSVKELQAVLKPDDIGYFQISDCNRVDLTQRHYPVVDNSQPPLMTLSRNARMFPGEAAGTLPVTEVCQAVFGTGYRGWVSMEVFHAHLYDKSATIPQEWAQRGIKSWRRIIKECDL